MAYGTILAALTGEQVRALRGDPRAIAGPSLAVMVSHLVAYWVKSQPLGRMLGEAVDGGSEVHPDLWHPLRAPKFQCPDQVRELHGQLAGEWSRHLATHPMPGEGFRWDIERVLQAYAHASRRGEAILSALERAMDRERAERVWIPLRWSEIDDPYGPGLGQTDR